MPDRDIREDAVDEVGGHVRHAPTTTGRTETAASAAERDYDVLATVVAVGPKEAVGQDTALEERPQLSLHEVGETGAAVELLGLLEERLEVLGDDGRGAL